MSSQQRHALDRGDGDQARAPNEGSFVGVGSRYCIVGRYYTKVIISFSAKNNHHNPSTISFSCYHDELHRAFLPNDEKILNGLLGPERRVIGASGIALFDAVLPRARLVRKFRPRDEGACAVALPRVDLRFVLEPRVDIIARLAGNHQGLGQLPVEEPLRQQPLVDGRPVRGDEH